MNRRHFLTSTAGILGSAWLVGCGSGNGSFGAATGRATLTVKWPERTRLIPVMANSIVAEVYDGLTVIDSVTLTRSGGSMTSTATFSNLPCKTLSLVMHAYPNANGTGVAQGIAVDSLNITAGNTASVTTTMYSTIDHVDIVSTGGATALNTGATLQLTATPKDADGNVVITPALTWSSSNTAKATVSSTGLVTGVAGGSVTIMADDGESNIGGTFNLAVNQAAYSVFYVYDANQSVIWRYNGVSDTNPAFLSGGTVTDIATDSQGRLYTIGSTTLKRYDTFTGTASATLTYSGSGSGMTIGSDASIYIAAGNNIHRYATMSSGVQTLSVGTSVRDVAVGTDGSIYVLLATGGVRKYASISATSYTASSFSVSSPNAMGLDNTGSIYIMGHVTGKLHRFAGINDSAGTSISYGTSANLGGHGLCVHPSGQLLIPDTHNARFLVYNSFSDASPVTVSISGSTPLCIAGA